MRHNDPMPDIQINMNTYVDPETAIAYWSVSWKFGFNNKEYGDTTLSTKDRYGQAECLKDSIDPLLEQAREVYAHLLEQEKENT